MKKIVVIVVFFIALACNNSVIEKPKNLIEEEQLENIIYDLSLLEAVKTLPFASAFEVPVAKDFLKKKYKLDSLTYVQNIQYYTSDFKKFRRLNDRVKKRLEAEENKYKVVAPNSNSTNQDEQGVVK